LQVKSRRSDDESSVDVSTTSSVVFDSAGSSGVSRSSTQTSQTSSPEHIPSKSLASDVIQQSLLSGAKFVSPHISTNHPNSGRASDDICLDDSSSSSLSASSSFEPVSAMNEAAHASSAKSRSRYIGPELLTDLSEPVDEEADFEKFKTDTRIRKIREFHQEAADTDIQLTIDIAEARKSKSFTREHEAKRIEEHERNMLKLRKRKEEERQKIVEGERQRRRTEVQQRVQPAPTQSSEVRPEPHPLVTRLAGQQKDTTTSMASETPTVRQSRSQRNALQMDWSSGGDTPTPTGRPSTWANQNAQTQPTTPADVIVEAPPLRRLPSAPSTSQTQPLAPSSARMSTNSSSNIVPAQSTAAPAVDQVVSPTNVLNQTGKAEPSPLKDKPKVISEPKAVASSSKTTLENMPKTSVSVSTAPSVPSNLTKAKPESATTSLPMPTMSISSASAAVSPQSKAEPLSASSSKPVTSSNPVRPKVEPKASSSSVPSVVSTASVSAKARVAEPVSSLATSTASTTSKPRVAEASTASVAANSVKPRVTEPATAAPTTVSSAWPASTSSKAAPSSSATAAPPSAWTSWAPPTTLPQSSQVPEDRRVWVPPAQATTEKSKRPPPTRKMTEPAPQAIEKTISNPQTKAQPIPIEVKRARRNSEPSSPSPKGFEFPHNAIAGSSKPADKRPEQPDASSRVSKKHSSSGSKSTKGSKSSAKKVTIEEIDDEEDAEVAEHLPTNSRYIMEPVQPKPVVPPAMFTQIFEYDGEQEKVERAKGVKANQATVQPENTGVEARSRQNNTGTETKDNKARAPVQDAGSSKPIRPKQVRWSSEAMQRAEPQKDSFLSILDSLEEAMMHSNDQPRGEEIRQQTEQLNRMLSEQRRR